jgi:hypothetical protein
MMLLLRVGLRFRIVSTLQMGSPPISACWAWHA